MNATGAFLAAAALLPAAFLPPASAETVRLHGNTTVISVVVTPHRDAVQAATGHRLQIVGNTTGKGLLDLVGGRADAALISEPLDIAVAAAALAGGSVDVSKLQVHEIRRDEVVFVVHPANPVESLTWAQLADIHTGKISNWREVGGGNAPIVVYIGTVTGGTRALVKSIVMKDAEFTPSARSLTRGSRIAEFVRQDPNGVGALGRSFSDPKRLKKIRTATLERPLALVTIGEPSAKVRLVLEAFRGEVARASNS